MNKLLLAALAGCLATSVSAKQEMTVTANPSFNGWVENASRTVDYAFAKVDISRSESGVTYVRFNCDEDGKPQNIATVSSGGRKPNLERVGRQVVRNIRTLHPMFSGASPHQLVEAAIIVADDQDELYRLMVKVNERAHQQNAQWAARGVPNPVVSLAVVGGF